MGDTVSVLGFDADCSSVIGTTPVAYTTSSTEVLSSAILTTSYPRKRILVTFQHKADATSTGVTCAVVESATSGGSYTAATTSTFTAADTAARSLIVSVKRNPAKPYIKTSMTPAGGSGVISSNVLFLD